MWGLDGSNSSMAHRTSELEGRAQVGERQRRLSHPAVGPESVTALIAVVVLGSAVVLNLLRLI